MNKFSYDFKVFANEELESGTSSMNVSSTKTKLDFFSAVFTIFSIFFFDNISPVGLFGLQMKTMPFVGIFVKNF